jgi:hypothetical protein
LVYSPARKPGAINAAVVAVVDVLDGLAAICTVGVEAIVDNIASSLLFYFSFLSYFLCVIEETR